MGFLDLGGVRVQGWMGWSVSRVGQWAMMVGRCVTREGNRSQGCGEGQYGARAPGGEPGWAPTGLRPPGWPLQAQSQAA